METMPVLDNIMKFLFEYKGYYGSAQHKDGVFYGKLEFLSDLVTYEADSIDHLEDEFARAVEDYFYFCKQTDGKPEKPSLPSDFKDQFVIFEVKPPRKISIRVMENLPSEQPKTPVRKRKAS